METIREPAVAGMFYPGDPQELRHQVADFLDHAGEPRLTPKALIAPHAGYVYSGPIAASAYAQLAPLRDAIQRVVLLGPAHRYPLRGLAYSQAALFRTPLGDVPVDQDALHSLDELPQVRALDAAFEGEHCLEVQLPFLQTILTAFQAVPLLVGEAESAQVAEVLERLWGGDETLIVGKDICLNGEITDFAIRAAGKKVVLQDDLVRALSGDITEIMPKYAPAHIAWRLVTDVGGRISAKLENETVTFKAVIPGA